MKYLIIAQVAFNCLHHQPNPKIVDSIYLRKKQEYYISQQKKIEIKVEPISIHLFHESQPCR
jgi:hypothetical protein